MEWQFVVAILMAIPIILLPVALIWYININGLCKVVHDFKKRKQLRLAGVSAGSKSAR